MGNRKDFILNGDINTISKIILSQIVLKDLMYLHKLYR